LTVSAFAFKERVSIIFLLGEPELWHPEVKKKKVISEKNICMVAF
jgi:hypothetical protein